MICPRLSMLLYNMPTWTPKTTLMYIYIAYMAVPNGSCLGGMIPGPVTSTIPKHGSGRRRPRAGWVTQTKESLE